MSTSMRAVLASWFTSALLLLGQQPPQSQQPPTTAAANAPRGKAAADSENPAIAAGGKYVAQRLFDLEQLGEEASHLDSIADRVRLLSEISDALWPFREESARVFLGKGFDALGDMNNRQKSSSPPAGKLESPSSLLGLILAVAARHDHKLARELAGKWADSLSNSPDAPNGGARSAIDRAALSKTLLATAISLSDSDPKTAAALYTQSAQAAVLPNHAWFLSELSVKHPTLADQLFSTTLDLLATRGLWESNELMVLSSFLFSPDGEITYNIIDGYNAANAVGNLNDPPRNPPLGTAFLRAALQLLNPSPTIPAGVVYASLSNLQPLYATFDPQDVPTVQQKLSGLVPSTSTGFQQIDSMLNNASARPTEIPEQDLLSNAEKPGFERLRDMKFLNLALRQYVPAGRFADALAIAAKGLSADFRSALTDYVNFRFVSACLEKQPVSSDTDIRETIERIGDHKLKAVLLRRYGEALRARGDGAGAIEILNASIAEASRVESPGDRATLMMQAALTILNIDRVRGLEIARECIREAARIDGFKVRQDALEFSITASGQRNVLFIDAGGPIFRTLIKKMSSDDFIGAMTSCRTIPDKTLRLWGELAAVEAQVPANATQKE